MIKQGDARKEGGHFVRFFSTEGDMQKHNSTCCHTHLHTHLDVALIVTAALNQTELKPVDMDPARFDIEAQAMGAGG
jgi:hypothetical protein